MSSDPRENDSGPEQGEHPVGVGVPAPAGLAHVLQHDNRLQALTAGFGEHGREVGDGRDVRAFVEHEEHRRPRAWLVLGLPVGRLSDLGQQADHERGQELLLMSGGGDVDGVAASNEPLGLEVGPLTGGQRDV